jgi:hypothetical protein
MRFQAARGLAVAGAIVTVLAAAACSSSSSSSSTGGVQIPVSSATTSSGAGGAGAGSASATPSASSGGSSTGTFTGAAALVKANWEKFFAPSTTESERVKLLENGDKFTTAIHDFSSSRLAQGVSAKVTNVSGVTATGATVTYDIDAAGATMAANQSGQSVYQDSTWKVGDKSFCSLLSAAAPLMNITVPAACKTVS